MKYRILFLLALVCSVSLSVFAQQRTPGKVVELIDGKTVAVVLPTGRVNVELRYIDVPEEGQPLYQTVRDHLQTLVVGKQVTFRLGGFVGSRMVGDLQLKGVDVGQQMLRDGAAWHLPRERSGQDAASFAVYESAVTLAKNENRGVWAVAGLKPPWQLRAEERERQQLEYEAAVRAEKESRRGSDSVSRKPSRGNGPGGRDVGALFARYDPKKGSGFIATPLGMVIGSEDDESKKPTLAMGFAYQYAEDNKKQYKGTFMLGVVALSDKWKYFKTTPMYAVVDEKKILIGKPKAVSPADRYSGGERLEYDISRATIDKLINAKDSYLQVGDFLIRPSLGLQIMLYNLLEESK